MQFSIELPTQPNKGNGSNTNNLPDVDWNAKDEYVAGVLGLGKHSLIGTVSLLTDLGLQPREDQVLIWDDKTKADSGWRLENHEDGNPKCEGARIETKMIKGKQTEVLVYPQADMAQIAISVDFGEKLINLDQFFRPDSDEQVSRPFRDIIGRTGWGGFKFDAEGKRKNVVAKPFNMAETNVNRQKKNAKYHSAFGKTSMIYDLAKYCKVLDEDENFHIRDVGKLLGKACMFEVVVEWNTWKDKTTGEERRKLETKITPSAVLSPRDEAFYKSDILPLLKQEGNGMLLFKGGNHEADLRVCNSVLRNTMEFALNWEGSALKGELESFHAGGNDNPATKQALEPTTEVPVSHPAGGSPTPKVVTPKVEEPALDEDFDEDLIPF